MWKDWFFFSKSQRLGILIAISIILVLLSLRIIIPHLSRNNIRTNDKFEAEAKQFLDSIHPATFNTYENTYPHYPRYDAEHTYNNDRNHPVIVLTQFNPNTADSVQFVHLGIRPRIASNIIKYRNKGGKFKQAEDIKKIWGLSDADISRLLPYVHIPVETPTVIAGNSALPQTRIQKTDAIIELNSADTLQLQQVKGIGAGFARRIVAYKKRLGGFVKVEQLREVWGITPELYNSIKSHFTVNTRLVQTININKASIEKLKFHPYLNFYSAKAIYELRLSKKTLHSTQELSQLSAITPDLLEKIAPYLSFQ